MIHENAGYEKLRLRNLMKNHRDRINVNMYRSCCLAIKEKCENLREFKDAHVVHIYVSALNNEVDTLGLIIDMLIEGKQVVVPKCMPGKHRMAGIRIRSLDDLKPSKFGLMEPEYEADMVVQPGQLDIIIVPLLAFDRLGGRVGFGGGYYDTLLDQCSCPRIGLAYSFQEVEKIPVEEHDRSLTIVITENEIIRM